MKRWLYLLHRWAGIALCLVMALWFLSGMVMLYVGYPKLTPAEQRQGLTPLPAEACCVPLAQAQQAAATQHGQPPGAARQWRLNTVAGEPRYFFSFGEGHGQRLVAVDARSGAAIRAIDAEAALASARHFARGAEARLLARLEGEDAWTHSRALDPHRPLYRIEVDDAERRWLYVSGRTGEVVRDATLTERRWGWIGAWLHWLYMFRGGPLDGIWTDLVIWLSLAGGVLALSGMVVGVWRWRFKGRYKTGSRSPYREPVARWHHLLGLAGGSLALTWVLSGLFSMNPWKLFEAPGPRPDRIALAGGRLQAGQGPEAGAALRAQEQAVLAIEWRRVDGQQHLLLQGAGGAQWLVDAQGRRVPERLLPGARVLDEGEEWLRGYDRYYYAREAHTMTGQRERPLPALRLRLDDAEQHWVVLDPATGAIVQLSNRRQRAERWLFAFLHSFDLPPFLNARPLWDGWMLGFSLAGLALSLSGVVMGWRRLRGQRAGAWGEAVV
ncbi:PepSY domain-containing protein [Roseateles sp. DAIF2]|nr:PepSY domain-containing protein [Roseateles sp. DAIF2]